MHLQKVIKKYKHIIVYKNLFIIVRKKQHWFIQKADRYYIQIQLYIDTLFIAKNTPDTCYK